jgi:hypothetical protein
MGDVRGDSSEQVLRGGGSVHLRAIRPDDKQRLREHSEGLSARSTADNELGWREAFAKLAALVEPS